MVDTGSLYSYDPDDRNKYVFPEKLDFQKEPFATVIPGRSSVFKVHRTEGLANSALSHHGSGAKYKQIDGTWVKVWEFYVPENCEACELPLDDKRDRHTTYYQYQQGSRLRSRLHRGSQIFAPFLCKPCYDSETEVIEEKQKAQAWRAEQKRKKALIK